MPEALPATISAAVEGIVDEAVLRRLILHIGARPGPVHGRQGKQLLQQRITGYNEAARFEKWAVLVDLDGDADCAPPLVASWLLNPSPRCVFVSRSGKSRLGSLQIVRGYPPSWAWRRPASLHNPSPSRILKRRWLTWPSALDGGTFVWTCSLGREVDG